MKEVILCLSMLLSLGMFSACSSDGDTTNFIEGPIIDNQKSPLTLYNQWVLVSYGNESNEVLKEAKGYYYQISFHSDGTFSGKAYGNEIGGKFKCNGKNIQIAIGDMTKFDFEGADPDQFFLEHLGDVCTYTITDTELRLYYSEDKYFKFRIKNEQL